MKVELTSWMTQASFEKIEPLALEINKANMGKLDQQRAASGLTCH